MHFLALFPLLMTLTPTDDSPALQLHASTLQPYIGQEVTLTLELSGISGTPELSIPWRTREFGFNWSVSPADWLRENEAKPGFTLWLPAEKAAIRAEELPQGPSPGRRYRLQWRLIVNEPDTLNRGPIVFAPVRLKVGQKEAVSNSLALERRKPPLMPPDLPALYLGVGDIHIAIELPGNATMDAALPLTLRITGRGALARVTRPKSSELWQSPDFRLDAGDEKAEPGSRTFRYTLYPRRSGKLTLPAIRYACFDPDRETYVPRTTGPWTLDVESSSSSQPEGKGSPSAGNIPLRLRPVAIPDNAFDEASAWPDRLWSLIAIVLPPMLWVFLWLGRFRWFPAVWLRTEPSSRAARQALAILRKLGSRATPEDVLAALGGYLHARYGLPPGEATPAEVELCLRHAGVEHVLASAVSGVLEQATEERFGVPPREHARREALAIRAQAAIHDLENARPC